MVKSHHHPAARSLFTKHLLHIGAPAILKWCLGAPRCSPWLLCSTTKSFMELLPTPMGPLSPAVPNSSRFANSLRASPARPQKQEASEDDTPKELNISCWVTGFGSHDAQVCAHAAHASSGASTPGGRGCSS